MSESRHLWGLSVSSQLSAAEKTGGEGITDVQMGRLPKRLKSSMGWPGNLHNFLISLGNRDGKEICKNSLFLGGNKDGKEICTIL